MALNLPFCFKQTVITRQIVTKVTVMQSVLIVLAFLSFLGLVSAGDSAPQTSPIVDGVCTTIWKAKRGSCNYYGSWTIGSEELNAEACNNRGCDIVPSYDVEFCRGDPDCWDRNPNFCQPSTTCTCNTGYTMRNSICVKAVCTYNGQGYLKGETRYNTISHGNEGHQCKADGTWDSWHNCPDPNYPIYDYSRGCVWSPA